MINHLAFELSNILTNEVFELKVMYSLTVQSPLLLTKKPTSKPHNKQMFGIPVLKAMKMHVFIWRINTKKW